MTPDLLREARLRAGLTQNELASRLRKPQSTIARWERGARLPSLETARDVVRACGLDLALGLARADDSYATLIAQQLDRPPLERIQSLAQPHVVRWQDVVGALQALETSDRPYILIGTLAEAMHGSPIALPAVVEVCTPGDVLPKLRDELEATIAEQSGADAPALALSAVETPSGTAGYADLARDAARIELTPDLAVTVASLRDLARTAQASPIDSAPRSRLAALRATLELARDGRP